MKPNYNNPSSYPPISLNSIIGKLMERIITSRLEGYVETNDILDEEKEGFRYYQGRIQGGGGAHPARAPPKIGKNMIFWRKILILHTKYLKNFRASLGN